MTYDFQINIDRAYPEYTSIDTPSWLTAKLGPALEDGPESEDGWADADEPAVVEWLAQREGRPYKRVARDNVYNHENNFSDVFVWSVWVPEDCDDWCWANDVYVCVHMHCGGDVRGNYDGGTWYRADSLADAGFTDWCLGWDVEYLDGSEPDNADRFRVGYASNPYYELERHLTQFRHDGGKAHLRWSDVHGCLIGRMNGRTIKAHPSAF